MHWTYNGEMYLEAIVELVGKILLRIAEVCEI